MGLAERYTPPPRTGLEVFQMLPEGTLAELINERIYMSPAPFYLHQKISMELSFAIIKFIKENNLGICISAPIDIFFDDKNILQPDILFISKENMSIIKDDRIKGSPDLIIEILSPGNKTHDTEVKKEIYEKFGVKEYYIVDPVTKEVITYYLQNKTYNLQPSEKGKLSSQLLQQLFEF